MIDIILSPYVMHQEFLLLQIIIQRDIKYMQINTGGQMHGMQSRMHRNIYREKASLNNFLLLRLLFLIWRYGTIMINEVKIHCIHMIR